MPLTRDELRGRIQTVAGLIAPADLGATLMHDQLHWDIRTPAMQAFPDQGPPLCPCTYFDINYGSVKSPNNLVFFDKDIAISEVARMRQDGGNAIVELSTGGLKPDPERMQAISPATGVHIVMGAGHYVDEYQDPANRTRSVESFATEIVAQLTDGAWGTAIAQMLIDLKCCMV